MNGARQRGLTLVELMVALVLTLAVVGVAASALFVARRGFTTVDAAGQLQDNARFAADLIQKIVGQGGYLDAAYAVETQHGAFDIAGAAFPAPFVQGYDNAINPVGATGENGNRSGSCSASAGSACANGSDILVLRVQASARSPLSDETDNAMINCMGDTVKTAPKSRDDLVVNVLHVRVGSDGEPSLMCSVGTTAAMAVGSQPVVQGVESFQVLYGVDGVTPDTKTPAASVADSVAERFLRADQLVVSGDAEATADNWRRVRALRIGMVLRGPPNSVQDADRLAVFYPLGEAMSSPDDAGSRFTPSSDGRLRQVVTFTVHLHNRQHS